MKSSLAFVALLCITLATGVNTAQQSRPTGEPHWFNQRVDHFDPLNKDTWKQKYTVNDSWWQPGSPIFFFLGGEAPLEFFEFQEVSSHFWAQQFGALYVGLEHRYYGDSWPVSDMKTNNMRYLSSQQALADAANFLEWFNSTLTRPGPWVVFGCSYSGALSAWFRSKYPQLVVGSVAPSGPILAKLNYTEFLGQFSKSASPECVEYTKHSVNLIDLMLNSHQGRKKLQEYFNTCDDIKDEDVYFFKWQLAEAVGGADQMDNPPTWVLNQTCGILTSSDNYLANFAKAFELTNGLNGARACNDFKEKSFIDHLRRTSIDPNGDRAWYFQKCTEFGFFQGSYPDTSIFFGDLPVEHLIGFCERIFDIKEMTPHVDWTNTYYGGMNLQTTNVLFTNGDFDPWHNLSVNEDLPSGVQAVTYHAGHCAPMTAPTDIDPVSLVLARQKVHDFLASLLKQQ